MLFDLLERNIQQKPSEKSGYDAFRILVENSLPDSAKRLVAAIAKVPSSGIPPAVGTDIDTLSKSKREYLPVFDPVLKELEKSDTRVGAAVKAARKPKQKN